MTSAGIESNPTTTVFLDAAHRIGARLCRDAIWSGGRCNWIGDSMEPVGNQWKVVHRALGPDFYDGTAGVAWFLAALYRRDPERLYLLTAEAAMRQAMSKIAGRGLGFYSGAAGIAFSAIELADVLGASWVECGVEALIELSRRTPDPGEIDVIGGAAGVIPALVRLEERIGEPFLLDFAVRLGDFLLARAERSPEGLSWPTIGDASAAHNLTGFSHGTAGIGWALLELHARTGESRFQSAAQGAFRYERSHYDAAHRNWPDFRRLDEGGAEEHRPSSSQTPSFSHAWCHGAPGIALSRLRAWQLTGDPTFEAEARIAIETTANGLAAGGEENFSLCHGLGGNSEALIVGSEVLGDAGLLETAREAGRRGLARYEEPRLLWKCGVQGGAETPNLLLGTAGIGYFYLRLWDSSKTPSVLIMTPAQLPRDWTARAAA